MSAAYPLPPAILRPSSAPRWGGGCPGSAALEALYPEDEDSPEAREGTAAHFFPSEHLSGRTVTPGMLAPNGRPIDAKMIEYAQDYLTSVATGLAELYAVDPRAVFRVETKVHAYERVHPANEGTPDAFALSLVARKAKVWDYKYGHLPVEVFENRQLINYAAGIIESFELTDDDVRAMTWEFWIAQPRAYHREGTLRSWRADGATVLELVEDLREQAQLAMTLGAPTRTGPHCRDCKARHACEAFTLATAGALEFAARTTPLDIPVDAMGQELALIKRAAKMLEARAVGLEQQITASIRSGRAVRDWQIGRVNSQERWTAPAADVIALADVLGVDLRAPEPVVTVSAARAKFKAANVPFDDLAALTMQPTGAAKLIPVDPADAIKAFGNPSKGTM